MWLSLGFVGLALTALAPRDVFDLPLDAMTPAAFKKTLG